MAKTLKKGFKIFKKKTYILVSLAILTIFSAFLLTHNKEVENTFALNSQENKFTLSLILPEKERKNAARLLRDINIDQNILDGAEFELDDISTITLAARTPIEGQVDFQKDKIEFAGIYSSPPKSQVFLPHPNLKIPQSAQIIIFRNGFVNLIEENYEIPEDLSGWLKENFKSQEGEYFLIFESNEFVHIIKTQSNLDLPSLAALDAEQLKEPRYKQETDATINYHLFNISKTKTTLVFFQMADLTLMASSPETAKNFVESQKSNSTLDFLDQNERVETAFLFRNVDGKSESALDFITKNGENIKPLFKNIREILVVSTGDRFFGHLDISD